MRGIKTLTTILGLALATPLAAQEQTNDSEPLTAAEPVAGEDWQAIVVGQPGPGAPRSFADAFHASRAFEAGGLPIRDMIRDMPRARLTDTLAALEDTPRLVLFYSGRIPSGSVSMQDGTMPLDTILRSAAQAGTEEIVLMVENCLEQAQTPAQVIVPDAPAGMEMMVVASAPAGGSCEPGARLTAQLQRLSNEPTLTGDFLAMLDGLDVTGSVPTPIMMTGFVDNSVSDEFVELLPEGVILLQPLSGDFGLGGETETFQDELIEIVLPAQVPDILDAVAESEPVITFAALPQAQIAALPIAAGLPEPSILVGLIEGVTDAALTDETDTESNALASFVDDNASIAASLRTLRNLREKNPEFYNSMLASGSFDPPEGRILAKVLQTELKRMNCYLSRVDGDYGRGSQRGSNAYYKEIQKRDIAALDSPRASIDLFRLIMGNDEVKCPTPVRQPVASRSSSGNSRTTTNRSSTQRATTQRAAPAARSAPATSAPTRSTGGGGSFGGSNFGGVFR